MCSVVHTTACKEIYTTVWMQVGVDLCECEGTCVCVYVCVCVCVCRCNIRVGTRYSVRVKRGLGLGTKLNNCVHVCMTCDGLLVVIHEGSS